MKTAAKLSEYIEGFKRRLAHREKRLKGEREKALEQAKHIARHLCSEFGAKSVYVFGSVLSARSFHEGSDIDMAVAGIPKQRYDEACRCAEQISERSIDLAALENCGELLRKVVAAKGLLLEGEPYEGLGKAENPLSDFLVEKEAVDGVFSGAEVARQEFSQREPNFWETGGVGRTLSNYYLAVEQIFKRIAVEVDDSLPSGAEWHKELLEQMSRELPGVRPAVIDAELRKDLNELLGFRHIFRFIYRAELEWEKLKALLEKLPDIHQRFTAHFEAFYPFLQALEGLER